MKRTVWLGATFALASAAGLLWKTQEVGAGMRAGLLACADVIIPSLFPFMILAGIVSKTPAGTALSRGVSVLTRPLGVPEQLGSVLLMSFVGGFPVGAQMLAGMLERCEISRETAERALCFCVNAGPSFLISAVGAGMLGSRAAGLVLLGAQILSSLVLAGACFHRKPAPVPLRTPPRETDVFVSSVRSASAGILGICAFVLAFSAISALLQALGVLGAGSRLLAALFPALGETFFAAALTGLLEVTGGCIAAATFGGFHGFVLCAFLVSFSSLSIIFQVRSCFPSGSGVRFGRFYRSRLAHGALTSLFAAIGWKLCPPAVLAAGAALSRPVPRTEPNMLFTCGCLIAMCTMLLLPERRNIHN